MATSSKQEIYAQFESKDRGLLKKVQSLAPHLGNVSLAKRIRKPESYVQGMQELRDIPKWLTIRRSLAAYSERTDNFFFVQIGANDGLRGDPIRAQVLKHEWSGLLVEPIPHVFTKLKHNYKDSPGLSFANVAVTDHVGTATMLAGVELPEGTKNPMSPVSSMDPSIVWKHSWMVDSIEDLVTPTTVAATTLPSLLQQYNVDHIDGLFIDTEGHDKVVLDQLDLTTHRPHFILYEHTHLPKSEQRELTTHFSDFGYDITRLRRDTFAEHQA